MLFMAFHKKIKWILVKGKTHNNINNINIINKILLKYFQKLMF